jgi:glutathione S-transferase
MITLYELHWSHYCEKIRLALAWTGLPWRMVDINAFTKTELKPFPLPDYLPNHVVPAIHDDRNGHFVMDSTPVMRYLVETYPQAQKLYPGDPANRVAIDAQMLEFDSQLGIAARRFAYSQVIFECPALLADLFLPRIAGGVWCWPLLRQLSGRFLGMLLCQRFEFHRSEGRGLYEALERYLVELAEKLDAQPHVVGAALSAADLTLAAQLRPLTIVPFFAEHPKLGGLFARRRAVLAACGLEEVSLYEKAIAAVRSRRAPVRREIREWLGGLPFQPQAGFAHNDQRRIWTWSMWLMPFHYFFTLRQGKHRQLQPSAGVR